MLTDFLDSMLKSLEMPHMRIESLALVRTQDYRLPKAGYRAQSTISGLITGLLGSLLAAAAAAAAAAASTSSGKGLRAHTRFL